MALGVNLSVSRVGSVINANVTPKVYNAYAADGDGNGLGPALFVGFGICVYSFINALGLVFIDRKAEKLNPDTEKA